MSTIVIKDLPENIELDRQAMIAITGGARTRGPQAFRTRTMIKGTGILNYPGNPTPSQPIETFARSVIRKPQGQEQAD
jgi:hypothetical protein